MERRGDNKYISNILVDILYHVWGIRQICSYDLNLFKQLLLRFAEISQPPRSPLNKLAVSHLDLQFDSSKLFDMNICRQGSKCVLLFILQVFGDLV